MNCHVESKLHVEEYCNYFIPLIFIPFNFIPFNFSRTNVNTWYVDILLYILSFSLGRSKTSLISIHAFKKHLLSKCYVPSIGQIQRRQRQDFFLGIEETVNKISKHFQPSVQQYVTDVVKEIRIRHSCNKTLTTGL